MKNEVWNEEQRHLVQVIDYIDNVLLSETPGESNLRQYIIDERRRIWDDYSRRPDDVELMQANQTLELDTERYFHMRDKLFDLQKTHNSPYFARIDFREDGEDEADPYYIGTLSLIDHRTYQVLICDWRADIASLFYDATLGPCSYKTADGPVTGEITLRRQICVEEGKLKYAFDTGLNITDRVLMEELGKHSDAKLKTIVTTIQKEQNRVIRDLNADLLLVQGSAGSGKTSVALHRLAFLLYHYRNTLTSRDVVIFSPSEIFSAYIADVLPELGEETAVRSDFYHYFSGYDETLRFCDKSEQTEALLASSSPELRSMIACKGSDEFAAKLHSYAERRYETLTVGEDLTGFGTVLATRQELEQWFFQDYASYPPAVRVQKIASRALGTAEESKDEIVRAFLDEATLNGVVSLNEEERREQTELMWQSAAAQVNDRLREMLLIPEQQLYLDFLSEYYPEYAPHVSDLFGQGIVAYEDLFPLALLRLQSGQIMPDRTVRQIVVDEAQDVPSIVWRMLPEIFPRARFTVLGDPDQRVGGQAGDLRSIGAYFPEKMSKVFYTLDKSYRSTRQINAFAAKFRTGSDLQVVDRDGEEAQVLSGADPVALLIGTLDRFHAAGHKTNLILCRTQEECDRLYEQLIHRADVVRLRSFDSFRPGTTGLLPVYLSKGLEADGVVIYGVSDLWNTPEDRALMYVAATRALHALTVIRTSENCPLLDQQA